MGKLNMPSVETARLISLSQLEIRDEKVIPDVDCRELHTVEGG